MVTKQVAPKAQDGVGQSRDEVRINEVVEAVEIHRDRQGR
jgi:hypothetical protein